MKITVVTGMSGAGKTTAMHALEDAGVFAVDNLPPALWPAFVVSLASLATHDERVDAAIGIDVRAGAFLQDVPGAVQRLRTDGHDVQVLFLDARDETLVKRFNFTRRSHPLQHGTLAIDLATERARLAAVRNVSDEVLDTTSMAARDLRARLQRDAASNGFRVRLVSFGYKRGVPTDVDVVLDVRGLRNPYYDEALRPLGGTDPRVQAHVFAEGGFDAYGRLRDVVSDLTRSARAMGRGGYAVAIGCTGGQHRSVAVVERLALDLGPELDPLPFHRDLALALAEHAPATSTDAPQDAS